MKKLLLILLCLPMIGFGQCVSGDCINGHGTYIFKSASGKNSGDKYVGEWRNNMRNGHGTNSYGKPYKGDVYEGAYRNNKKHGEGTYTFANGNVYEGEYREGMRSGQGTYTYASGNKYEGEYRDNKKHGQGTYTFASGDLYKGGYSNDKKNGEGTYVFANGLIKKGLWEDNKLIESLDLESLIKKFVEQKVNEWQAKGEFEKTSNYLDRVSEKNRAIKIKQFQQVVIESLKVDFLSSINFSNIILSQYDADNETFLLKDNKLGDIVVSVPISEAKMFKANFSSFSFLNPECVIIDENLILSYVEIKAPEKRKDLSRFNYIYNLDNAKDYAITDIDYTFSAIEIDDIASAKKTRLSNISTKKIKIGSSSVNINIPTNKKVKNRYALVIGNEDYSSSQRTLNSEQNVDYAENDAKIFKEYALKTLGVEDANMFFLINATGGQMSQEIDLVSKLVKLEGDKAELIVYYAGHGYPDELTKVPYLIPVDVSSSNLSRAIKLDDLYQKLANTNASKIIIFLDACFTGGGRNLGLVASRGIRVKPKEGILNGNLVVFSASTAEQSSLPYHDEGHGIFTYFLLKKFQEDKRSFSLGDLSKYLEKEVAKESLKVNRQEQNPTVNISSEIINNWINWKL